MAEAITQAAIDQLRAAEVDGFNVRLTEQLDQEVYREVNEVLIRLGGKWKGGRKRAHVFQEPPLPLIEYVLDTGVMPPKNPEAFFATPEATVHGMLMLAELDKLRPEDLFLEPEAGAADIADYLCAHAAEFMGDSAIGLKERLYLVEQSAVRCNILRRKAYEQLHEGDFLQFTTSLRFARILMNPPFSVKGDKNAYITHILHAYSFLDEGGLLVAIAPDHFIRHRDKQSDAFLRFVAEHGYFEENDAGAFKESGTNVPTVTLVIERKTVQETSREASQVYDGYLNYYCFLADLKVNNEASLSEEAANIYEQIRAGEFHLSLLGEPAADARAAITGLYERAVDEIRRAGGHMRMEPAWMDWLVDSFMEGYEEHCRFAGQERVFASAA